MNRAQFKDALEKGHGRALQYTRSCASLLDEDLVMQACVEFWGGDWQIEGPRIDWMLQILDAAHALPRLADPLLRRVLTGIEDLGGAEEMQREALLMAFIERGYTGTKEVAYALLPHTSSTKLCESLTRLDGKRGLIKVAKILLARDRTTDITVELLMPADCVLGDGNSLQVLRHEAQNDKQIETALQAYEQDKLESSENSAASRREQDYRPSSARELISLLRETPTTRPRWAVQWARHDATADDLALLVDAGPQLAHTTAQKTIMMCLWWRAYEPALPWLQEVAWSSGEKSLRHAAMVGLAQYPASASQRSFAERWLRERDFKHGILTVFAANYRIGDAANLMQVVRDLPDHRVDEKSWSYHALMGVWEASPEDAGIIPPSVYEEAPCAFARFKAVRAMVETHTLTPSTAEECKDDSFKDTRALVAALDEP